MVLPELIGVIIFTAAMVICWILIVGIAKKCGFYQRRNMTGRRMNTNDKVNFYKTDFILNGKSTIHYAIYKDPEGRIYIGGTN